MWDNTRLHYSIITGFSYRFSTGQHPTTGIEQQFHPISLLETLKCHFPASQWIDVGDQRRGPHTAVLKQSQRGAPGGGDGRIAAGDPQLLHADLIEVPGNWFAEESDLGVLPVPARKGQQGEGSRSRAGALEDDVGAPARGELPHDGAWILVTDVDHACRP